MRSLTVAEHLGSYPNRAVAMLLRPNQFLSFFTVPLQSFIAELNQCSPALTFALPLRLYFRPSEAPVSAIAPLTQAGVCAIVEPFSDRLFGGIVEHNDIERQSRARADFFGYRKGGSFAHRRLRTKRSLT